MTKCLDLFNRLRWINGTPLSQHLEPYRCNIFRQAFDRDDAGRFNYNLILCGRGKKNWKSADLVLAALWALLETSPIGNQCYLLANDEDQAAEDLGLAKKFVEINAGLKNPEHKVSLVIHDKEIRRRDGKGFLKVLPANSASGEHGRTYRFVGFDEIHAYKNWDLLEALQLDPTRTDSQMWITSYASIHHKPGVPLFDLLKAGWSNADPRMLFSWYGADRTTDPDFADFPPEQRANPSMSSWADPGYLDQQRRRLPAHKFRRLHLNMPGLPEGSAFKPEPIMEAIARGVERRLPEEGVRYVAFVDMSGGSSDDAVLAIAHASPEGQVIVDLVMNQGPPPPFDPNAAVKRFAAVIKEYGRSIVVGDKYAGETFRAGFRKEGIEYELCRLTRSELYEAMEPLLNARQVELPDVSILEQQLLGLVWRGSKIDHPNGEHDDWANGAAGAVVLAGPKQREEHGIINFTAEQYEQFDKEESAAEIEAAIETQGFWFPGDEPVLVERKPRKPTFKPRWISPATIALCEAMNGATEPETTSKSR